MDVIKKPQITMRFKSLLYLVCISLSVCIYPSCQKAFSLDISIANGTLWDSTTNACPIDQVAGTFYDGIKPGQDTAYVIVNVDVTAIGDYTITSNTVNGMYFSNTGTFTNTGINTIKLKPAGTPIAIGTSDYSISFGSVSCGFTVTVKDSTGTGLGSGGTTTPVTGTGTWQFTTASGTTTSSSNATGTLVASAGINGLSISGTNALGDTALAISLTLPSSTVPASGSFTALSGNAVLQVTSGATTVYSTVAGETDVTLTVTITSYNSSTKELIGTFSGVVKTTGGANATISTGAFDVVVQ